MRVFGELVVDLRRISNLDPDYERVDEAAVHSKLKRATEARAGDYVLIKVDPGQYVDIMAIAYLREHGKHLGPIRVQCSNPLTCEEWTNALQDADVA